MQSLHRVEKSPPSDGTGSITAGDLSTQSIIKAFSICPIPTCSPARDDGGSGHHWTHLRWEGSEGSEGGVGSFAAVFIEMILTPIGEL